MGILDFFRKFKKEKLTEKPEKEKVSFSEIPDFISKKESELKEKEKIAINEIDKRINFFLKEIPSKIIHLENVDVKSKKAEDRLKSVVIKSRKEYLKFLNNFLENLNNIRKENLKDFNIDINKLFSNFTKSTYKNYERTTILIGKEMAEIKKEIKSLSNNLLKILQENKEIPESLKKLSTLRLDLEKLNELEDNIKKFQKEIENIEKEKLNNIKENKEIFLEIDKIKQSKEYQEYLEKKQKINSLKNELTQNINILKQKINFKALASFFHVFENKMKIVKDHKENFPNRFEQDNGKSLLDLLEESRLNEKSITKQIQEIKDKKQRIKDLTSELKENNLKELSLKKENIALEIINLGYEKDKKQKKLKEFKNLKETLVNEIKTEISEFNVEFK
jgi:hypothetical protein